MYTRVMVLIVGDKPASNLFTTDFTWLGITSNPGLLDEGPANIKPKNCIY